MTRKTFLIALVMLIVGVAIGGAVGVLVGGAQQQNAQGWEYQVTPCPNMTACTEVLNSSGDSGYQLASTLYDGLSVYLFLMRPK